MRSLIRNFALTTIPARAIKWALTLNNDTTMKRLYVILCMVALLAITSLAAEKAARKSTIHLRSGEFVTGVITARDNQMVEIVTDDQMKYVYDMSDVDYITHDVKKKNYDTAKFRGFIDLGYSLGVGEPRNNYWLIETSFGYQVTPLWYVGAGVALHHFKANVGSYPLRNDKTVPEPNDPDWKYPFIPFYLNGRYNLRSESQHTPWVDLKVGATFINHTGFFTSPSIGYHFATNQFFTINVGVGYALQTATYKLWCLGDTPGAISDDRGGSYVKKGGTFHNLFVKIGVEF